MAVLVRAWVLATAPSFACVAGFDTPATDRKASAVIYGADDRVEYFEVAAPAARERMSQSIVALIPKTSIRRTGGKIIIEAASLGEVDGLCPGERFTDQPAAAFCTGILADWDLVLTAGHCVRLFAVEDFAVVFDYYYTAPGQYEVGADILTPVAIVAEALDPEGSDSRLDYAWLRLSRPAEAPRQPAPVYVGQPSFAAGDPIISIGTGGGVPLKMDSGGKVRDPRAGTSDYFVADTDTTKGSSGGGAFDQQLALAGILVRGQADLVPTDDGCKAVVHDTDGLDAMEHFTYSHRAIEGLCEKDTSVSSLCRPDCGEPCRALSPSAGLDGGCALAGRSRGSHAFVGFFLLVTVVLFRRRGTPAASTALPSSGTSFGTANINGSAFVGTQGEFFADVTGDGKADAIVVNDTAITVRSADTAGTQFLPNANWLTPGEFGNAGLFVSSQR